jgi:hypothetical protein
MDAWMNEYPQRKGASIPPGEVEESAERQQYVN